MVRVVSHWQVLLSLKLKSAKMYTQQSVKIVHLEKSAIP